MMLIVEWCALLEEREEKEERSDRQRKLATQQMSIDDSRIAVESTKTYCKMIHYINTRVAR